MLAAAVALACAYQLAPPLAQPRVPHRRAPAPAAVASSFAELGLRGELCDALEEVGITEPNDLQRRVMPALAGRADVLIGARTGSGKTLAYLLPIMQTLRTDEEQGGSRARARRPRALVLLPTRELALQVRDVARSLCRPLKISVAAVHGGVPEGSQKRMLEQPVDLLVATPGRLLQHLDKNHVYFGDVRHVVIDEVDTMFEAGFGDELERILSITTRDLSADSRAAEAAAQGMRVQHVAVGATHPEKAKALYATALPGAKQMLLEDMHTAPPTLKQEFVTCNGPDAKVSAMLDPHPSPGPNPSPNPNRNPSHRNPDPTQVSAMLELLGAPDEGGKPRLGRLVLFCNSQASNPNPGPGLNPNPNPNPSPNTRPLLQLAGLGALRRALAARGGIRHRLLPRRRAGQH